MPGTVAKGTLGRCSVRDIRRKLTEDCAVITPMLQAAHIIATPADLHEVLRTLGVVQMQPVAPPTLQAPMPPSISSDSSAQIVRPGNNVQEYQKALILAVADDDRPLLQRRVARLIGAGHSPSAVMADMSKAFKVRTYTEKEKAIAGLAALGVGGCEFLKVANRGGTLPSYDTAMVDMKFEEPLRPGIAPTTTFILKRLPNHPDPLLWDLLVDEISLQPQIGVVKSGHATGTCRTCTSREHRLVDQETVDELANLLEDSNSNVHLAEYATVWSVAAHHGSLYRPIPHWVVPTCNRFTSDDMAQQRRQLVTTFREVLKSARPRDAMALTATDGDSRRSRALDESLYRELARAHAPMEVPLPFYSFFADDLGMAANFDPIHELGRLRNAILSRSIKMYSVHLVVANGRLDMG